MLKPALLAVLLCPLATSSFAASFECSKAGAMDELAICNDRELSELDVRSVCNSDRNCLRGAYLARIETLKKHYNDVKSRGPF